MDEPIKVPGEGDHYFTKKDNRSSISYFLEHDILLPRFTLSVGLMAIAMLRPGMLLGPMFCHWALLLSRWAAKCCW